MRPSVCDSARCGAFRLRWILCALVMLMMAKQLDAQSTAQRVEIEAYRDSLAPLTDSLSLQVAEKLLIARASHEARDSAMVHLRLGFLALRLGDLAGKQHYEDAASEFQWVVDLQPKWPYAHLGLGLAELGVGDATFAPLRGLQTALGKDALTRSANEFARSAEVDPGFVRGLVELSNTALRQRVNLRLDVALAALRRAAATPAARNPEIQLARARIEREVGSADSALNAIDAYVAQSPNDPAGLLEQARVRFKLGRRDGGEPWYRGLATADAATLALYRYDLRFVLPDSTLKAFDATPAVGRANLMRRFWERRDIDELHRAGDRLVEHYRRLDVARHQYRLASTHRRYDIVERYRPPVAEFDDRGVVYIRQGAPDERASLDQPGVPFNESWLYHRRDGPDLVMHFVARDGVTDFRLVESVLDIMGFANAVKLGASGNIQGTDAPLMPPRGAQVTADSAAKLRQRLGEAAMSGSAATLLRSRARLDPIYQKMLVSGRGGASGLQADERAMGNRSMRIATTTDEWERRFARALPADVQVLASAIDSVQPVLRVAYAIPASAIEPLASGKVASTATRVTVAALDAAGTVTGYVDTTRILAAPVGVAPQQFYYGILSVPVNPGLQTVRIGLETDRAGVVSPRDTVDVPAPARSQLSMSDIAIGARSVPLWWLAEPGDTVWINPRATFRATEPIEVYYQLSGLVPDSTYRIEVVIKRPGGTSFFKRLFGIFGGGGAEMKVTTPERASGVRQAVHREIAIPKLKPAAYTLEVTISGASGRKVTRRQDFTVIR